MLNRVHTQEKKQLECFGHIIYYIILLVIIFNNILLSSPIAFIYYLIFDGLFFWYIKFYLSIIENRLFFITFLKSALVYYSITVLIFIYQYLIYWNSTFLYLDHLIKPYNWQKPIEWNQSKMMLIIGEYNCFLKCKRYTLEIFIMRL